MNKPDIDAGGLRDYSVIVTGGGTGIGRACAAHLIAAGASVTICGRTENTLREAGAAVAQYAGFGGTVRWVTCDVTKEDDVKRLVDAALSHNSNLKGCVANAGGGGVPAPFHEQSLDEFKRVLGLNVVGTFLTLKHTIPHLIAAGGGSFVAMSSIASHLSHRYFGAYPAAKAGIEQMMRVAADEYGPQGVRCNSVCPGFTATEIMEMIPRDSAAYRSYRDNTPMNVEIMPDDIGALVRFLVGPESRYLTAQTIDVDGGNSLRAGPDFGAFVKK